MENKEGKKIRIMTKLSDGDLDKVVGGAGEDGNVRMCANCYERQAAKGSNLCDQCIDAHQRTFWLY